MVELKKKKNVFSYRGQEIDIDVKFMNNQYNPANTNFDYF